MKFVLFVEGHTEHGCLPSFLKQWLDTRLKQRVGIQAVRFEGCKDFDKSVCKKAQLYLDGPRRHDIVAVIGLLDLYGPQIYPPHLTLVDDRYQWGVKHYESLAERDTFRMFFAVHEVEAWILSQPEVLPHDVRRALPGQAAQPESVNFREPPAKLLDRLYKTATGKAYKKTTDGKELFRKLDPEVAAQQCPYLRSMLEEMLRLAQAVGL